MAPPPPSLTWQFYIETPITATNNVSGPSITTLTCPNFYKAIKAVLTAASLDISKVYPSSGTANGCSIATPSPTGAAVRVFFKAYLVATEAQWQFLSSPAGLANAAFVVNAKIVCGSILHFGPGGHFAQQDYSSVQIPALGSGSGQCQAKPVL